MAATDKCTDSGPKVLLRAADHGGVPVDNKYTQICPMRVARLAKQEASDYSCDRRRGTDRNCSHGSAATWGSPPIGFTMRSKFEAYFDGSQTDESSASGGMPGRQILFEHQVTVFLCAQHRGERAPKGNSDFDRVCAV